MRARRRILIYGNSVILGAIGASLSGSSEFEVKTLNLPQPGAHVLDNVKPDVLLFDLESPHSEAAYSLLATNPRLLLIGISPGVNLVKIWSGRQVRELSTQRLLELIKSEANDLDFKMGDDENHFFSDEEKKKGVKKHFLNRQKPNLACCKDNVQKENPK